MLGEELCSLLGIKYPIFQGAMAWISDSTLAAGVSEAGGLGIIAGGGMPPDILREEIKKLKEITKKPFGVNLMLMLDYVEAQIDVCIEEKVPVITTGAGNPGPFIKRLKEAGIKIIPVVASVALAKRMEKFGVDAVIAEGMESGGHVGETTTMVLVPQIVDVLKIPVIAAGGIATGKQILAAMVLGACGVQIGTRFIIARECNVHKNYKEAILKAKDRSTIVTGKKTGHPVRVIENKLAKEFLRLEYEGANVEEFEKLGQGRLKLAVKNGDIELGSVMSGQVAALVNKEESCNEIIESLMSELNSEFSSIKNRYYGGVNV